MNGAPSLKGQRPALYQPRATPWAVVEDASSPVRAAQVITTSLCRPFRAYGSLDGLPRALPWADIFRPLGAATSDARSNEVPVMRNQFPAGSSSSIAMTSRRFALSSSSVSAWECAPLNPGTYPTSSPVTESRSTTAVNVLMPHSFTSTPVVNSCATPLCHV